jgi:hypothetical protein
MTEENDKATENNHAIVKKRKRRFCMERGPQFSNMEECGAFVSRVEQRVFKGIDTPEVALVTASRNGTGLCHLVADKYHGRQWPTLWGALGLCQNILLPRYRDI